MKQWSTLSLVVLVTACGAQVSGPTSDSQKGHQPESFVTGAVCRLSPDGGPVIADRGIGGTGAPSAQIVPAATESMQIADRGIGGTGIVGVITGFASVCVNGLEVTYDENVRVDLNGAAAPVSALRAGQVVVIQAEGPAAALRARTMSLRQEVSGRIEAIELGSGLLTIAGVPVAVPQGTWGANRFGLGDWVAVSGLPRTDGVIVASRLDAAPSGVFSARGRVVSDGTVRSIGRLVLTGPLADGVNDSQSVVATGVYANGQKQLTVVSSDRFLTDPNGYFEQSVNHLVVQAFVRVATDAVWINGQKVGRSADLRGQPASDGLAVVSLDRGPNGSFGVTELHAAAFRDHTISTAEGSRGPALGNPVPPPTRHASLGATPRRDETSAAAMSNLQPATTTVYLGASTSQSAEPLITSPLGNAPPAGTPPASSLPLIPTSTTVTPSNAPMLSAMPPIVAPAGILPSTSMPASVTPVISPSILANPTTVGASSPVAFPVAAPTPPTAIPPLPPAVLPSGVPQVESVYAPLISSNTRSVTTSSIASAQPAIGSVLASQIVQSHTVSGVTTKPTISLVTTTATATLASPSPTAPGVGGLIRPSSNPSSIAPARVGKH